MQSTVDKTVVLDGQSLTLEQLVQVARYGAKIQPSEGSLGRVRHAREYVEKLLRERKVVYGLTTGFGKFSDTYIEGSDVQQLQLNLIRSHACGLGEPFSSDTVRAMLLLRINALLLGYSGIRAEVVGQMVDMLNYGVTPVVPQQGSLGASGDLAPLAHMALVLIGEGEAYYEGQRMPGAQALASAGLLPVVLEAKEGLALINGTQVMTAVGALACYDAWNLARWSDCTLALTAEALRGVKDAFDPLTHRLRPQPGQGYAADNFRALTRSSRLLSTQGELRVQDAYSIRCAPQVHGASRDGLAYIQAKLDIEINAVTDNPLIFPEQDRVISGGNFHGQPIALAMDHLSICSSELANIAERRIERLVNPQLNEGLPPFLTEQGGVQSGFMIAQYAAAALVSENKSLAHPASVDSIPSSANQEDHVSMGTIGARKARQIIDNAYSVLAIELMCAAQAADYRGPEQLGTGTRWVYEQCRQRVSFVQEDRVLSTDFRTLAEWMKATNLKAAIAEIIFMH
ncbi:histidine ammonia-lyase [Paenibacillus sp. FSL K6-1230]|uniref:histidine ammonia-lyase n=1 Tax=Paenibacillus sp. FSL K6-1230 TaxID=2921603 RepID=UPI0003A8FDA3